MVPVPELPSLATYFSAGPAKLFWDGRIRLVETLLDSAREGDVLREPTVGDNARFARAVAFGQFADSPQSREQARNAGLFGTAAAIEVLAPVGLDPAVPLDIRRRALSCVLRGWDFVDLAVLHLSKQSASKYAPQAQMTLRMAHVLRAAAAVEGVFARARSRDPTVVGALDTDTLEGALDLGLSSSAVAQQCVSVLRDAKGVDECGFRGDGSIPTWRFVVGDQADPDVRRRNGPRNLDQAVYLASSVLVALVRAQTAEICHGDDAAQIFSAEALRWLVNVTLSSDGTLDPRFRLFACWALSHVTSPASIPGWTRTVTVDDRLTPGAGFAVQSLASVVKQALASLRRHSAYYVECLSDYRILRGNEYGRDYFGIPVLPVAMVMAATWDPPELYRQRMLEAVSGTAAAFTSAGSDVVPYQASVNTNGVVYLSYAIPALAAVGRSTERSAPPQRAWYITAAAARDHPAVIVAIVVVISALVAAVLLARSHPATLGVVIGIIGSLAANLFLPPLVRRLWGASAA